MKKTLITALMATVFLSYMPAPSYAAEPVLEPVFSISNVEPVKLSTLIHAMARKSGMGALVNPAVDGTVLISFADKTITEAMESLSDSYGFAWYIKDNMIVVSPQKEMITRNKKFYLQFADPELVKNELKAFIEEKQIVINPEESAIAVDTSTVNLKKAAEKIAEMDKAPQQILIKAQIVELTDALAGSMGFNHAWGEYSNLMTTKNIQYTVTAMANDIITKGKVVAAPSIMTINGRKAVLEMGSEYPILQKSTNDNNNNTDTTVEYKPIGYFLTATPRVNNLNQADEYVTMSVEAKASTITGWVENKDTRAPQMSNRRAATNVRVKDGDTIIIGGLIKDEDLKTITKIPGLGDLPLIGNLFKSRSTNKDKSQIFIFLTPHIVHADVDAGAAQK